MVTVSAILGGIALTVYASDNGEGSSGPCNLTDEQREAIKLRVQELREAGATREEIRAEITAMLQEWGIELPAFQHRRELWLGSLTEEQRAEIRQIVQDTREETRAKITAKLEEWGVEVPEFQGPPPHKCYGPPQPWLE